MGLTLISSPDSRLPVLADPARAQVNRLDWLTALEECPEDLRAWAQVAIEETSRGNLINSIFGNSPYLTNLIFSQPATLRDFFEIGPQSCVSSIVKILNKNYASDIAGTMERLRVCKAQAALVIALADISNVWGLEQVTEALSDFADACVGHAVRALLRQAHSQGAIALSDIERPELNSGFVVLGLGKLGARELNYSSDIDLLVFFDEEHVPYVGKKTPQEFAVRLTKDLVRLLHERTTDGYVFRTDLRLRPDPGSTAVAVSREAAQIYYESYGQNWERAALIKARPVAGDRDVATSFLKELQPFIWRKSLDFYAIQDIQSIKRQMYAHKGGSKVDVAGHNIKLGRGGIREVEFYAQIQQLIWGGRFPEARAPQTLLALEALTKLKFISREAQSELSHAYKYLRKLEHRLQMVADEQTQTLPSDARKLSEIAAFMGHVSVGDFAAEVTAALRSVEIHYANLFEDAPTLAVEGNLVFTGTDNDPDTIITLQNLGFENPQTVIQTVRTWHHGRYRSTRSDRARQLLTEIVPGLLAAFGKTSQPDSALVNFDRCLASLPAGVSILSVFYSNPQLLDLVGEIMGDAPRLAEHLSRRPALLDYVLEPEFYQSVGTCVTLSKDLEATLATTDVFEQMLDICRRWVNDQQFRVGVQCLRHMIDPVAAAENLTSIADAALINLVPVVSREFSKQYGYVTGGAYALIGYGKLGSYELTPTSDLDLVAVYDANLDDQSEGGSKSLPASAYYMRLTQRVVTAFTSLTQEGRLFEIDMRLRPSGNAGPLACSLKAFRKYQFEDAWTWEHMALSRARVVVGEQNLKSKIESTAMAALTQPRNDQELVCDVASMRKRIRKEHKGDNPWDIKHRTGGLVDIEFICQYLSLRFPAEKWGNSKPNILISRLRSVAEIGEGDLSALEEGMNFWSRLQFMLRLTTDGVVDSETIPTGLKSKLATTVNVENFSTLETSMVETTKTVSELFSRLIEIPASKAEEEIDSKEKH